MQHGLIAENSELMLVRAVAHGDEKAVDELYRIYSEPVMRFIFRRVDEHLEDAEEITLDTFVSAINLANSYGGHSSIYTWLCGIAKLRLVDFYRKKDRSKRVPESMTQALSKLESGRASLDEVLNRVEAQHVVDTMLEQLNEDEREAILLRYVEQLSVREISILMNRSEKGIEGLLARAKGKAKYTMSEWLTGGSDGRA
ncbi:MAG: RNA polymerase sigma factor [Armatimonadetes bacterium]|nr:RNA polymerase sigma factor [Armatimonadota bacterium]